MHWHTIVICTCTLQTCLRFFFPFLNWFHLHTVYLFSSAQLVFFRSATCKSFAGPALCNGFFLSRPQHVCALNHLRFNQLLTYFIVSVHTVVSCLSFRTKKRIVNCCVKVDTSYQTLCWTTFERFVSKMMISAENNNVSTLHIFDRSDTRQSFGNISQNATLF